MKMEGVNEVVNGRSEVQKPQQPSPKEIGREFVRQYYTMLSEQPQEVFRFYSHESFFVHDLEQPVQGQQKIREAIERLEFVDCKARIYTVSGTATINNGLVIQTPKKYYVHNDVFQWLDRAFVDNGPLSSQQQETGVTSDNEAEERGLLNGEAPPTVNGHQQAVAETVHQQGSVLTESVVEEKTCESEEHKELTADEDQHDETEHEVHIEHEHSPDKPEQQRFDERAQMDHSEPSVEQQPRSVPVVDSGPKTWAKLVGGNNAAATVHIAQPVTRQHIAPHPTAPPTHQPASVSLQQQQPPPSLTNAHQANDNDVFANASTGNRMVPEDGCHLYVGGITRHVVPEGTAVVEKQLRSTFEKFGVVTSVNVPRRVLEAPDMQRSVYAFVVMKSVEGAKCAFNACRKDRGKNLLHIKLDSFGFDGEATLSEQKAPQVGGSGPRGAPFAHRGPPMQGMQRGGYGMRGGAGSRGRGMHPRGYPAGGNGEYRNAGAHP